MIVSALILCLLSLQGSEAVHLKKHLQMRATTKATASRTCKTNIENFKNYRSQDYQTIMKQTTQWTDPYAPTYTNASTSNDMFYWSENSKNEDGIQSMASQTYWLHAMSTKALSNKSIYGSSLTDNQNDIKQGELGDCYFLAGISALAENAYRLNETIETDDINKAGIFTMRAYIKGLPTKISVDDYVPFKNYYGSYIPYFAQQGTDGSIWAMLMEKVWAKVNGNYEFIIAGGMYETFDFLGGCPFKQYSVSDNATINNNGANAYAIVDAANKNNYIMGASCCNSGTDYKKKNLVSGHAYTTLGANTITNSSGSWKLILIRNPWGSETFNGTWGSTDRNSWTSQNKAQAPQYSQDSGNFYIEASDFVKYFSDISVGFFVDTYVNNYLEVLMCDVADTDARTYYVTFPADAGQTRLGLHFYNDRMYTSSSSCSISNSQVLIKVTSPSGTTLVYSWYYISSQSGFQHLSLDSVTKGKYTISVQMQWTQSVDVPDYTIRVYTDQIVTIESATNEVGSYNYALDKRNGTVSVAAPEYKPNTTCVPKMTISSAPNNTYLISELTTFDSNLPSSTNYGIFNSYENSGSSTIPGKTSDYNGWFKFKGVNPYTSTITMTFSNNGGLYATKGSKTTCSGDTSQMTCVCKISGTESCLIAISGYSGYSWSASYSY